jgi:hypothetical protein
MRITGAEAMPSGGCACGAVRYRIDDALFDTG